KVIDDYTLEFELQDPTAYFGKLLVMPIFYPVNEKALAEFGDQYALDPKKSVYSGPYIMTEWSHGSKVVLERNPNYWTKDKFKIEKLIAVITADLDSAANSYENGELTITKISPEKLKAYKDKPELVSYSDGRVYYFSFNLKNDILKNQKVRQALSLAVDRDKLVNEVLANGSEKGSGIVASGMPGIKDNFRKENGDLYAQYKDEDIKKLFEEGLQELGKTPADVKLSLLIDEQGTAKKEAEFYQAQWREKLGIDVSVDQTTKKDRIARSRSGDYDIVRYSWGPDFADAMTYLELFFSNTEMNIPRYVNSEYDELLSIGRKSNNHDERTKAMERAEKIVTDSFAYSGLYYQTVNILVNSKVKNVHFRSVGAPIDLIDATLN
ncbi:MAG: peptide ABC transporter substrate-binding protein, partial [Fusobacteriales bacterium]|nr:peptide ABC transporter substrate-binding protein [Fusobacteriales bacterium]